MDDTDFKKQRISLFISSIAIILYIVGEGSLGNKGGVFGGTIVFKKPIILEYMAIFAFIWFIWRYMITGKNAIMGYFSHYKLNLFFDKKYGEILKEAFKKVPNDAPRRDDIEQIIKDNQDYWDKNLKFTAYSSGFLPPLVKNILWPSKFCYYVMRQNHYSIFTTNTPEIDEGKHKNAFQPKDPNAEKYLFKAPFFKMLLLEIKVFIISAFKKPVFSDVMAPLFSAGIAIIFLILKMINII